MYRKNKLEATQLNINTSYIGETIEKKVRRIMSNKEPISDGAPLIYQERSEGVQPGHDIRTDRFEVAIEAMDKVSRSHKAKREERLKAVKGGKEDKKGGEEGSTQSTGATADK